MSGSGDVVVTSTGAVVPVLSAAVVVTLGAASLARSGPGIGSTLVLVLGTVLLGTVLLDRPRRTRFTSEGIERVCPLRTSVLPWTIVVAVERVRTPVWRVGATGGLVARSRRGRWLLSDRAEDPALHDALVRLVADAAPHVRFLPQRPGGAGGKGGR